MAKYIPLINEEGEKLDKEQIGLERHDLHISNVEEKWMKKVRQLRYQWMALNEEQKNESQRCTRNDCVIGKRMKKLLILFDEHLYGKINQDTLDFITIYNECINYNQQYPISRLIDDFHHLQRHPTHCRTNKEKKQNGKLQCKLLINVDNEISRDAKNEYFGYSKYVSR